MRIPPILPIAMLLLLASCDGKTLGEIDFLGYGGFDIDAIRSALPFHEGELFPPRVKSSDELKRIIGEKVKQVIGHEPTSISFVCCDAKQRFMIYIGLPGASFQTAPFHAPPTGDIRLAPEAMKLHAELDNAFMKAILRGHATEDDSEGYTLTNDPEARKRELAVREYALRNEKIVLQVLLLTALTKSRDSKVLAQLRAEALDALIEMARWRSEGHAEAARLLVGRIAGIKEDHLNKLIDAGQVDAILDALRPR